jgi:hypothetical protein
MIFINVLITIILCPGLLWVAAISYAFGICFIADLCYGLSFKLFAALYSICMLTFVVMAFIAIFAKVWGHA